MDWLNLLKAIQDSPPDAIQSFPIMPPDAVSKVAKVAIHTTDDIPVELPFTDADFKPAEVYPEGHIWHKWYETPIPATTTGGNKCRACSGSDYWQSVHGLTICRKCHPPAPSAERIT